MKKGLRSFLFGMHNPLLHGALVFLAWRRIYGSYPGVKESVCILLHDVGYVRQDFIDGVGDKHPELGARICSRLFGPEYYLLCLVHSRDYAKRVGVSLSRLGYADKYSVLLIPDWLYAPLIYLGGEAQEYHRTTTTRKWGYPIQVSLIKADYRCWWEDNKDEAYQRGK